MYNFVIMSPVLVIYVFTGTYKGTAGEKLTVKTCEMVIFMFNTLRGSVMMSILI